MTATRSFRQAIGVQPENLRAAATAFAEAVAEVDLAPLREGTLVLSGIGASSFALVPIELALRAAGRRAFAVSSAELLKPGAARLGDAFVLVSQSGASAETVAALEQLADAPVVAISARADTPLARGAGAWLPLGPEPDTTVSTLSYTATLQALGMLCEAVLGSLGADSIWGRVPELAEELLARSEAVVDELAARFAGVAAIDAVGSGAGLASAGETALLAREALRLSATAMETRQYLHGPLEAVDSSFGCVVFGGERERDLAAELVSFGAPVALISDRAGAAASRAATVQLPRITELAAPILQILPVQLLIDRLAEARGIAIGDLHRRQHDTKVPT
ncbi:MAG TPA: SIS domain-containing protein [Solirubrobacteraceae bacterium]|jgi:glucosamine--fructose-6-phosphate aminotransferase (isomerizing)